MVQQAKVVWKLSLHGNYVEPYVHSLGRDYYKCMQYLWQVLKHSQGGLGNQVFDTIFEPMCAYAQWALKHRILSGCLPKVTRK